jgi:hypothetical protein
MIAASDREIARRLAEQQAETLDVARGLRAQASTFRGRDRRFESGPSRLSLRDERVEAHGCR